MNYALAATGPLSGGRYTITLTPKAEAQPTDDIGKYITVYERQGDGSWRMARDIWNSDSPPPGAR